MKTALSILLFVLCAFAGYAQEEGATLTQGRRYLDINIHSLEKYIRRIDRQQAKLLARLKRKEQKFARQLAGKDSAGYARYKAQPLSYDSISNMLKPDSAALAARAIRKSQPVIDSLKKIQGFLQSTSGQLAGNGTGLSSYNGQLGELQGKLGYQQYIQGLIDQRGGNLKNIAGSAGDKLPALKGIEKELYYGKAKMNAFKQMADDPSLAEDEALEYLQGVDGFDKAMSKQEPGGMQSAMNADDLEKMGFQTKRQLNAQLQEKFGNSLSGIQEKMGNQVADWQNKTQGITGQINNAGQQVKNAGEQVKTAQADLQQTKQSLKQVKHTKGPSFKVNPMRGLPFRERIEKQYNWQTSRSTPDGQPAMLQASAMAGFRHTPKLSYGVGIAGAFGLGQNWSNIHFTFEGIGLRTYASWLGLYGIGGYAGYERTYKQAAFTGEKEAMKTEHSPHNTGKYNESVLVGLTKSYKVNAKWNGQVQVLYDIWWKDKGLRSPVVLRFATATR